MNTRNHSETLEEKIYGEQPKMYELRDLIIERLAQFSPSPRSSEILEGKKDRLLKLLTETVDLSNKTGDELYALRIETMAANRAKAYFDELEALQARVPKNIANILSADNYLDQAA